MTQQQFDADSNEEEFTDFHDNPIRKLFDKRPSTKYERSFLDKCENMPNPPTIRDMEARLRFNESKRTK